jgi:P-type Ca2+ transporter type 2C
MIIGGFIMAAGTLAVFMQYDNDYAKATTMAFTTFTFFQFFNVLNCRSRHFSIFSLGLFTNTMAIITILIMTLLHVAIVYTPFLQSIFHTVALTMKEWVVCVAIASSVLVAFEIKKLFIKDA